jgi:hypothetical protein
MCRECIVEVCDEAENPQYTVVLFIANSCAVMLALCSTFTPMYLHFGCDTGSLSQSHSIVSRVWGTADITHCQGFRNGSMFPKAPQRGKL